jgi:hypothetical protein
VQLEYSQFHITNMQSLIIYATEQLLSVTDENRFDIEGTGRDLPLT